MGSGFSSTTNAVFSFFSPRRSPMTDTARRDHRTERHGTVLDDPYHWLRDPAYPTVETPEILDFLAAENAAFERWMAPHRPLADQLFEELKGRIKEDDESVPVVRHGWAYQWRFAAGAQYRPLDRRLAGGGV